MKNLCAVQGAWVRFLGWEDPLEKGMAPLASNLRYLLQLFHLRLKHYYFAKKTDAKKKKKENGCNEKGTESTHTPASEHMCSHAKTSPSMCELDPTASCHHAASFSFLQRKADFWDPPSSSCPLISPLPLKLLEGEVWMCSL